MAFNQDNFHLIEPVQNGSVYRYITTDDPDEVIQPAYFLRARNRNVRENDVVSVTCDRGAIKYHADFCIHVTEPVQHAIIGEGWRVSKIEVEEEEDEKDVISDLMAAFRETPRDKMLSDGRPDRRRYMHSLEFTQDEWEQAVSFYLAEREREIAEANTAEAVNS